MKVTLILILMVSPEVFCSKQMDCFGPQNGTSSQLWIDSKSFLKKLQVVLMPFPKKSLLGVNESFRT